MYIYIPGSSKYFGSQLLCLVRTMLACFTFEKHWFWPPGVLISSLLLPEPEVLRAASVQLNFTWQAWYWRRRGVRAVCFAVVKYCWFSPSASLKRGMLSLRTPGRQLWAEGSQRGKVSQSSSGVCFLFTLLFFRGCWVSFCYVVCCCFTTDKALFCVYFGKLCIFHFVCQNVWHPSVF